MHANEVGRGQQFVQAHQADAELRCPGRGHVRVIGDDPHAERGEALGDEYPDPAKAENAGDLVLQFHAGIRRAFPLAGLQRGRGLRHVPCDREQQGDGVLGGADDVGGWRVHHHDARLGGSHHIDVVQAHASPGNHPQARRARERLGVDLRRAADNHGVGVGERGKQHAAIRPVGIPDVES